MLCTTFQVKSHTPHIINHSSTFIIILTHYPTFFRQPLWNTIGSALKNTIRKAVCAQYNTSALRIYRVGVVFHGASINVRPIQNLPLFVKFHPIFCGHIPIGMLSQPFNLHSHAVGVSQVVGMVVPFSHASTDIFQLNSQCHCATDFPVNSLSDQSMLMSMSLYSPLSSSVFLRNVLVFTFRYVSCIDDQCVFQ
jgi:hypothetical protein